MKSLFPALVLSLLLAPVAVASHSGCYTHPPREGIANPLKPGTYLLLTSTDTSKIGEWSEVNGIQGLQTDLCMLGSIKAYGRDHPSMVLP